MRLALIRQRYNPYGGAERFVQRALDALRQKGVAVTVFARQWNTADAAGAAGDAAPVELVRCNPFFLGRLWRDAGFGRAACSAVAQRSFDLVQSHERIACCDVYRAGDGVHAQWLENRSRQLGQIAKLGVAINPYHAYVLAAERRLFASPRLRAVICNSHMVAKEIRARYGVSEGRLHVIYSGVDLEAFHPRLRGMHRAPLRARLGIAESETVHLMVGSGFERKGVPQLLQALARLPGGRARLVIVGADRRTASLRRRADAMGLGERVIFAGPQMDPAPWYGLADCFVLPTLYDPFPNAALEAMACGLPVITSTSCGAAELVAEGRNGFVCDALDVESLAGRMGSMDQASARRMGEQARAGVSGMGLAEMAERLVALYESLLQRGA